MWTIIILITILLIIVLTIYLYKKYIAINRGNYTIDETSLFDTELIIREITTDNSEYIPTKIQTQPTFTNFQTSTPTLLLKIAYFDSEVQKNTYNNLTSKLFELVQEKMSSIEIDDTQCYLESKNYKNCKFKDSTKALSINIKNNDTANRSIYLYPHMAILINNDKIINAISYNLIKIKKLTDNEFAPLSEIPATANITYKQWLHQRKDGGPDRRYSVNYLIGRYITHTLIFLNLPLKIKTANDFRAKEIIKLLEDLGFTGGTK